MTVAPELIARVDAQMQRALLPLVGADWSVPATHLEWSCRQTGVHIADSLFAHAARIVAQPQEWFVPAEVTVDGSAGPAELVQVIGACAGLLRCAALDADPTTRAFHPWGSSDPDGSVAMGAAEGLVHTWDIVSALGGRWRPPSEVCRPVLERLFPDAPAGDAADVLLWCTGRTALPEHPRRTSWRWYSAVHD
jgi:hypothetical protein